MVTLAGNLYFFGSCFQTCLAAIFVASLNQASAGDVGALNRWIGGHN